MSDDKITWFKTGAAAWGLARSERGYAATIALSGSTYTLAITGSGAPADTTYATLRNAKNGFRKFLATKPLT